MRTIIDEQNYKMVKALLDAGMMQTDVARITDISYSTIGRISATANYAEYNKKRKEATLSKNIAYDIANMDPRTSEPKTVGTVPVSPTAEGLIAAVNKVATALEKNNEILSDIYEKIGDSQVSLQELVSAWRSEKQTIL